MTATPLTPEELDYQPSYRAAAIVSALILVLYLITLAPSTAMWDTSEYIAAAYTLGLPHPPGNPLFVLLGRFFAILPIAPNVAMRINILAALCSAGAAGMWFLITERVLVGWLPERWQRIAGGSLAALIGAIVAGQLGAALLIDQFGWVGFPVQHVSPGRIAGVACLFAGVLLVRIF
jgi:succinate dehydrogenase hydrophobic anchor subunit